MEKVTRLAVKLHIDFMCARNDFMLHYHKYNYAFNTKLTSIGFFEN